MARFIESATTLESALVSAERVFEYGDLPSEADWEGKSEPPPKDWPQRGVVEFDHYSCRYRSLLLAESSLKGYSSEFQDFRG